MNNDSSLTTPLTPQTIPGVNSNQINSVATPPVSILPNNPTNFKKRTNMLYIVLLIVIVAVSILFFLIFYIIHNPLKGIISRISISPLEYQDQKILSAAYTYTIKGRIEKISLENDNYTLTLNSNISNLPLIVIEPDTIVSKLNSEPFTSTNSERLKRIPASEIQTGQEVTIELMYGVRSKKWFVRNVILPYSP